MSLFLYGELNPSQTDGDFWGIKGFSLLWEDMCHTFFFKKYYERILYADTDISLKDYSNSLRVDTEKSRVGNYRAHDGSKHWNQWIYNTVSDVKYPKKDGFFGWNELLCIELDPSYGRLVYNNPQHNNFIERDRSKTQFRRFPRPDLIFKIINKNNPNKVRIIDYKYVDLNFYGKKSNKLRDDIIKQLTYELAIQQTHVVHESWFFIPYFYVEIPKSGVWGEKEEELSLDIRINIFKANFSLIQNIYLE